MRNPFHVVADAFRRAEEERAYLKLDCDNFPEDKVFVLRSQKDMIEKGILQLDEWTKRWEITKTFEKWCHKNLKGYYHIWAFGNGFGNHNQVGYGIWKLEVRCMRPSDIATLKMFYG
jgi:hypothetical protein